MASAFTKPRLDLAPYRSEAVCAQPNSAFQLKNFGMYLIDRLVEPISTFSESPSIVCDLGLSLVIVSFCPRVARAERLSARFGNSIEAFAVRGPVACAVEQGVDPLAGYRISLRQGRLDIFRKSASFLPVAFGCEFPRDSEECRRELERNEAGKEVRCVGEAGDLSFQSVFLTKQDVEADLSRNIPGRDPQAQRSHRRRKKGLPSLESVEHGATAGIEQPQRSGYYGRQHKCCHGREARQRSLRFHFSSLCDHHRMVRSGDCSSFANGFNQVFGSARERVQVLWINPAAAAPLHRERAGMDVTPLFQGLPS